MPVAKEVWAEAAIAWNELAALKELLTTIDRMFPAYTRPLSGENDGVMASTTDMSGSP